MSKAMVGKIAFGGDNETVLEVVSPQRVLDWNGKRRSVAEIKESVLIQLKRVSEGGGCASVDCTVCEGLHVAEQLIATGAIR